MRKYKVIINAKQVSTPAKGTVTVTNGDKTITVDNGQEVEVNVVNGTSTIVVVSDKKKG